jgi:adenylyltransferase/sulfurtransferase
MSNRYDRLLELSSFTKEDLKTLQNKKVLITGAGGVGQHAATYLVTNGVENITILDFDKVELSNLNRQILLTELDYGKYKVNVVKEALNAKNKDAHIEVINSKLDKSNVSSIITTQYDIVVDALDNWEGKFLISDECHKKHITHLHVGVDGMSGQYCVFKDKSLRDILPIEVVKEKRDGVMGPVVGAISSMASTYLIQYLLGQFKPDELVSFDFSSNSIKVVKL